MTPNVEEVKIMMLTRSPRPTLQKADFALNFSFFNKAATVAGVKMTTLEVPTTIKSTRFGMATATRNPNNPKANALHLRILTTLVLAFDFSWEGPGPTAVLHSLTGQNIARSFTADTDRRFRKLSADDIKAAKKPTKMIAWRCPEKLALTKTKAAVSA
ncbi:unnamed protein product, partial [marine sediment metagenome]